GVDDPFGQLSPAPGPASAGEIVPSHEELHGGDVDPLSLLGFVEQKAPPSMPKAADLASKSVLSDHYKPPIVPVDLPVADVAPSPSLIPDDYDPLSSTGGHSPVSKSSRPADPSSGVHPPRGSEPPVAASPRPQPSRSASTPEPRAAKVDAAPPD